MARAGSSEPPQRFSQAESRSCPTAMHRRPAVLALGRYETWAQEQLLSRAMGAVIAQAQALPLRPPGCLLGPLQDAPAGLKHGGCVGCSSVTNLAPGATLFRAMGAAMGLPQ